MTGNTIQDWRKVENAGLSDENKKEKVHCCILVGSGDDRREKSSSSTEDSEIT